MRRHQPKALLFVLTLIFFFPVVKPIEAHAVGGLDMRALFYPWLEWVRGQILSGQSPFWDAAHFGGYPFLSNPQVAIFYPPTWLAVVFRPNFGITLYLILHVWLAGVGMYLLVRGTLTPQPPLPQLTFTHIFGKKPSSVPTGHFLPQGEGTRSGLFGSPLPEGEGLGVGVRPLEIELMGKSKLPQREGEPSARWWEQANEWGGIVAAVAWMFSGFFMARVFAGHIGLLATHVWLGWLLWGTMRTLRDWSVWRAILLGVPLGLAVLAGHTTSLLYIGMVWGLYTLYLSQSFPRRQESTLHAVSTLIIAGIVGLLLLSGIQLLPLVEFARVAGRSADTTFQFASRFSFPIEQLITLFIPEFFGESAQIGYWGAENFEELTYYAGVFSLLAVVLAIPLRLKQRWFWLGIIALGVMLGLGSNGFLFEIFYEYVPGFRLARAPARGMVLYTFGGCVLLGLLVQKCHFFKKWHFLAVVGLVVVGGIYWVVGGDGGEIGRIIHQRNGWLMASALAVIGGAILFLGGGARQAGGESITTPRNRTRLPSPYALRFTFCVLLFTALLFTDLWLFGAKLVRHETIVPSGTWFMARDLIDDHQRILPWGISIFEQNGAAQVGLDSVFGYNALEVGVTADLFRVATDPRSKVYDLFGADYVVAETGQEQFTEGEDGLVLRGENGGVWVYDRPNVLPLVRLVPNAIAIPENDAAITMLLAPEFDPATTAIVSELPCEVMGSGQATITEHRDSYWRIETKSAESSLLVVSETAYPGWRAYVDGERVEWQTAYTTFRAVCVPAGEHVVEWRFIPTSFVWGGLLTMLGIGLILFSARQLKRHSSHNQKPLE